MPTPLFNSTIFGNMFTTPAMQKVFCDENLLKTYIKVEIALAKVQADLGIIPHDAYQTIANHASVDLIDRKELQRRTEIVGYPILPLVEQLSAKLPNGQGQFLHYGATTQDIMDTAFILQMREGLDILSRELTKLRQHLVDLAKDHATTAMPGRTHLQHALPISFGHKVAGWLSGLDRHAERLQQLRPRLEVVSFFGAAGTLASLHGRGIQVQKALALELELHVPDTSWHTIRDNIAEASGWLALVTGSIGKMGYDIMFMMQTEIDEVREPFLPGRGASSTMPQKRNPISSEIMLANAALVRAEHVTTLTAMINDHERATGPWHMEWHAIPTAFLCTAGSLESANFAIAGLEVDPENMMRNLNSTSGLIVAEAVMMALAPHIGRQYAHDLVYDCCRSAISNQTSLYDQLSKHDEVTKVLNDEELRACTNPQNYLGEVDVMISKVLKAHHI